MIHYDEFRQAREHTVVALAGGAARHPSYLGHYPWVERPQAFRAAVEGFLGECASF